MFTNGERAMFTDGELQCLQWGSCKLQCLQRGSSNVYRGVVAMFTEGSCNVNRGEVAKLTEWELQCFQRGVAMFTKWESCYSFKRRNVHSWKFKVFRWSCKIDSCAEMCLRSRWLRENKRVHVVVYCVEVRISCWKSKISRKLCNKKNGELKCGIKKQIFFYSI